MATSLSKIKSQIEKLQKRAASIQNVVIARIKREIDKHGLSVGDLFSSSSDEPSGVRPRGAAGKTSTKAKKAGVAKPAKFADGQGNTWHGIGKRPQWIHDALGSGKKLEDFLIGANPQPAPASTKPAKASKAAPAAKKSAAAKKKAAPVKAALAKKAAKSPDAKKAVKTAATAAPVKAAKKGSTVSKAPSKKAPAKKAASRKTARTAPEQASAAVDAAAAQN